MDPARQGDERAMLAEYLDVQRTTMVRKVAGLDRAQLGQRLPTSSLTLGGLVKHLALVEDSWFTERFLGLGEPEPWASAPFDEDEDWDFHSAADHEPTALLALYAAACERSRQAFDQAASLDTRSVQVDRLSGEHFTLRWVVLHLLEETARHAGPADLLREAIDGATGD